MAGGRQGGDLLRLLEAGSEGAGMEGETETRCVCVGGGAWMGERAESRLREKCQQKLAQPPPQDHTGWKVLESLRGRPEVVRIQALGGSEVGGFPRSPEPGQECKRLIKEVLPGETRWGMGEAGRDFR